MAFSAETMSDAVRLHQAGRLAEAEALYPEILGRNPDSSRGPAPARRPGQHQQGQNDRAAELIGPGHRPGPPPGDVSRQLGVALRGLGRLDEADAALRRALRLGPDYRRCPLQHRIGLPPAGPPRAGPRLPRGGAEARARPRRRPLQPRQRPQELGRPEEAIPLYRRAHRCAPGRVDVLNNLGNALLACERAEEAIDAYRRAVALRPRLCRRLAQPRHRAGAARIATGRPPLPGRGESGCGPESG